MNSRSRIRVQGLSQRRRWLIAAAVALLVLVTLPTVGSSRASSAETLRLHIGSDGTYVHYTPSSGTPETQVIPAPTRCELAVDGPLLSLSASDRGSGLHGNGIGTKSGGSQGIPCSRVDASEDLSVALGSVPSAVSADLDLELKGDVRVRLDLFRRDDLVESLEVRSGAQVVAGEGVDGTTTDPFGVTVTSDDPATPVDERIGNCRNDSDSGPDAGSRDNCRVTVLPTSLFDEVMFTPLAGEVSLNGSGDFADDPDFDTIFHLAGHDGELGCDEGTNTATESDGEVVATIIRYANTVASDCVLKPYVLEVNANDPAEGGAGSVIFEVDDPVSPAQAAIYEAFLTFDQPLNTPLDAVLEYDSDRRDGYEDFKQMPACEEDPFDLADDPPDSLNDEAIPEGHEGCVVDVSQEWDGNTTWHVIFAGDWKFRG